MVYMIKHSIIHAIVSSGGAWMTRGLAIVSWPKPSPVMHAIGIIPIEAAAAISIYKPFYHHHNHQ